MALNMNQLAATTLPADDDIMHVRNTSGIDVKITWANLRKGITSYDEKSSAFTTTESTENEGKLQVFKNTSGAAIVMTLGSGGPTLSVPAGSLVGVIYNGTDWSYATPLIDDGTAVLTGTSIVDTLQIADSAVETAKINDTAVTNAKIGSSAVSQAKLKTSQGSVSGTHTRYDTTNVHLTLPGGEYGFYPKVRRNIIGGFCAVSFAGSPGTTYLPYIHFSSSNVSSNSSYTFYAQQRYVTSSGEVYWYFCMREKETGLVKMQWQAPDHPCFGNNLEPEVMPHPFGDNYDPVIHEIIVVNPLLEDAKEIALKARADKKDFLEIVEEDYDLNAIVTPQAPESDGTPGYYATPVSIGLDRMASWPFEEDGEAIVEKRIITRPSMVEIKKFTKKVIEI